MDDEHHFKELRRSGQTTEQVNKMSHCKIVLIILVCACMVVIWILAAGSLCKKNN